VGSTREGDVNELIESEKRVEENVGNFGRSNSHVGVKLDSDICSNGVCYSYL
jgi:hypothetical protein